MYKRQVEDSIERVKEREREKERKIEREVRGGGKDREREREKERERTEVTHNGNKDSGHNSILKQVQEKGGVLSSSLVSLVPFMFHKERTPRTTL